MLTLTSIINLLLYCFFSFLFCPCVCHGINKERLLLLLFTSYFYLEYFVSSKLRIEDFHFEDGNPMIHLDKIDLNQTFIRIKIQTRSYTADAVWYRQPSGQPTNTVMLNLNKLRVEKVC